MIDRAKFSDFRISIWLSTIAELSRIFSENRLLENLHFPCVDDYSRLSSIQRRRREKIDDGKSDRQRHDRQNDEELPTNKSNDR